MNTYKSYGVCSGLRLIGLSGIARYATMGSRVYIIMTDRETPMDEIPGTLTVDEKTNSESTAVEIKFDRKIDGPEALDTVERFAREDFIALYRDQYGNDRAAGSPETPLMLEYTTDSGVLHVTITGTTEAPSGYYQGMKPSD